MTDFLTQARAMAPNLVADRRYLHAHAETGFNLTDTCRYVMRTLNEMGLMPRRCGRSGIIADIGTGDRFVILRADMDALPIREETSLDFACEGSSMHACGHDLHTAMLLGAARLLKAQEKQLNCRVRLMFQPAEEILKGAQDMLDNGLLSGGTPVCAYMIHVLTNLDLPVGTAVVSAPGAGAPAAAFFEIALQGKGCHGAMPNTGIDPITAAAHIVLALQQIQTRELAMAENAVLTLGMLQAGDSANVIPDRALMAGTMRTFDDATLATMLRRTEEIAVGTAQVFRAEAAFTVTGRTPTLLNDEQVSASALNALRSALGPQMAMSTADLPGGERKAFGSEDFAFLSHALPSVMVALAAGRPGDGHDHPAHHPMTTFDEEALIYGAAAYAAMAIGL